MSNKTQEVTIIVQGELDEPVSVDLVEIENDIRKNDIIDTTNWEGIPDDYVVGSIPMYHDEIDWSDDTNPICDISHEVFEQVRIDLFTFVGTDNKKTGYWYLPKSKEKV